MQERERADHYLKLMQQVVSGTGIEVWGHEKVLAGPDRIVARAAELAHASQDAKVHMRLPHVSSSEHLDTAYHNSIANGASLWLKERAMNMLNEGITISDVRLPENPLIYANQAFYSMTGYTPEETLGRNCRFLQGQATDPGKVAELSRCIRNGEPCAVEILNYRKDGTPFVNYLSVTPIKDCIGKVTHYVGIQSDISELVGRKQAQRQATLAAEAAEASTAVKSRFLATMSHEIRTPLNGMIGVSQLLAATELTPEQKDYVSTVLTSSETLLSLVNDILDFSKIEADKLQLQYQDFNLAEVLDFAIDLAGLKASEKRINIVYSLPATVPRCVRGDPVRLQQVLLNIMNNAVKFTDAGEVEVTVSVSVAKEPSDRSPEKQGTSGTMTNTDPTSSGGSGSDNVGSVSSQREGGSATCTSAHKGASYVVLRFMVRDTGIGISEEGLSRLFLSFSQLDSTPTRRYGGSGLGLVISKRLCEVMGGSMWAESKGHGQGSTFTFTIKCAISENSPEVVVFQPGKVWCQTDTEKSKLTGKRIVLVEENEKVRLSLAAALTDRGADVLPMDSTSSVKAFLTSSGKEEVHAYVLGEECCEALKESVDVSKCIIMAWPGSEAAKSSQYFSVLQRPIKHLRFFHAVSTLMDGLQSAGANVPYALGSLSRTVDLTHKPSVETASDFAKRATRGSGSAAHAHTQGLEGICCSGRVVKGGCQEAKKQKLRLLVAEDHVVNLKVALGLLKKLGHTDVVVAHDGVEALERLKQDPQGAYGFDAILMDLNMPRMGGIEAVKEIIRLWPDAAGSGQRRGRVRIIAVTADALEETQTLCLRTGFDGWLPKPFRLVDLENALRTAGEP
uniref:histidine kinase n=1 Tax=Prasinococcus capsulatus TaxID=156131 RepID=A0A126X3P9_9VIRI|nr:putative LOV domain-containing protein [Prasinococcus capsulatus]